MEENQITCPQCGLVNNFLADTCVQCGIIFVKDPAMRAAAAALDDEKRKSIEAAEAILEDTQPPADIDTPNKERIRRPDPREDTVELRVPKPEGIPPLEAESSDSQTPEPEEKNERQNAKIGPETIENDIETVTETDDTESPISEEIKAVDTAKAAVSETAEKPAESLVGEPAGTENEISAGEKSPDSKPDDGNAKEPEAGLLASDPSPASAPAPEPEQKPSASEAPAKADNTVRKPTETVDSDDKSAPEDKAQPDELEIQLAADADIKPGESDANKTNTQAEAPASPESTDKTDKDETDKKDDVDAQAKQAAQKARKEALIKHQEQLLKAETRKKEEAVQAKAAAVKRKKLARAKAEALKKQKVAQAKAEALKKKKAAQVRALALRKKRAARAKAEALKKQKVAQARAEESAENVEVAAGGQSNYVKLLGLLKRYKGKAIGINYDNSAEIKEAELVEANEEFFSIRVKDKKVQYSYPLKTILTIVEGEQGVETGEDDKKARFDAVIKVYPLVLL